MKIDALRAEAEDGSVVAQGILGISYLHGYEVSQDYQEAYRWLSAAAARGAARPSAWLGTMFENGLAVPVDVPRARELYEHAARQNEFYGHLFLARLLASGKDGSVDDSRVAAEYGQVLRAGVDECPELEEARAWLSAHPDAVAE